MFGMEKREGQNGSRKFVDVESDNGDICDTGRSDWRQDLPSIVLLLILYTLQGIPIGLSGSIPFLLLDKVRRRQRTASAHRGARDLPIPTAFVAARLITLSVDERYLLELQPPIKDEDGNHGIKR